jgi:hypothetical protein
MTFADKVIAFNKSLAFEGVLPDGIRIMNPFRDDERVLPFPRPSTGSTTATTSPGT